MKQRNPNTTLQSEQPQTAPLEQQQAASPPTGKFYTPEQVLVGSLFGSLLMGAYMMSHNFCLMGQPRRATNTWLVVILLLGFIIAIGMQMKNDYSFLNLIPILLTAAAYHLTRKWQAEAINSHIAQGGNSKGWLSILLIVLAFDILVILASYLLVIFIYIY